jgi:uncharacterized protein
MPKPNLSPFAKLHGIGLTEARWTQGFWADRFEICKNVMVPTMGRLLQNSQRIRFLGNFEVALGLIAGTHRGPKWNDGDFFKWMESASAVLAVTRDESLDAELDRIIELIGKTQAPDGYIHTDKQIKRADGNNTRFADPMDFEMYNMGHLMSAACVHHRATGKLNLLRIATKAADFLDHFFEKPTPEIARHGICPAHLMGLVELYHATDERRYLDLAVRLLNMRDLVANGDDDNQDRIPFRRQREAVGHAVRATYLYAGAADIFAETGDETLMPTLLSTWDDLVSHKMHITSGCGPLFDGASPDGAEDQKTIARVHQALGRKYQLPQSTAHNETCAAIGNLLWNWRMLRVTGESRFADVIEHALLNSVLAGISLDGTRFFYTNTLRQLNPMPVPLRWPRRRQNFMGCWCCPPNVLRTIAQSSSYAYAKSDRAIWVVLYGGNVLETEVSGGKLKLRQETDYPWEPTVKITIEAAPPSAVAVNLRIPAWAKDSVVHLNGKSLNAPQAGQFYEIDRKWSAADVIELSMPMPVRLVEANPYVEETRGQVAVMRGPIVYCVESVDLPKDLRVLDVRLPAGIKLTPNSHASIPGITFLEGKALAVPSAEWSGSLYRDLQPAAAREIDLRLVPYFAWDNRGESEMSVWIPVV